MGTTCLINAIGDMMYNVLEEISLLYATKATSSQKRKMLSNIATNPFVKWYFHNLIAPNETFGIKVSNKDIDLSTLPEKEDTAPLMELAPLLQCREVTGNEARNRAIKAITALGKYWTLGAYLLNKKTPPSLGKSTIFSVYPDLIPAYACGVCRGKLATFENDHEHNWIAQRKYDGVRVIIRKVGNEVKVYSRNFNELNAVNFCYVIEEVREVLDSYVIDGELDLGDRQRSASFALSKKDLEDEVRKTARYYVFDLIPRDNWEEQKYDTPLKVRNIILSTRIKGDNQYALLAQSRMVKNMEEANEYYKSVVGDGTKGEGIVLKRLDTGYVFGDNPYWIKLKYEETVDGVVVGFEEGTGRLANRLGALIVDLESGKRVRVGGGFSDAQRQDIWSRQLKYLGRMVEFKANGKTKYGATNHAVFLTFRSDK